jgi:hypothetical protein
MTEPGKPGSLEVGVRDYADGDYDACRSLWAELTEYHRDIYGDPSIGGDDPGAAFDEACGYEYLTIRPVARNVAAVRRFHAAGFSALGGHIDLTMDLAERRHDWPPGASLDGLEFGY